MTLATTSDTGLQWMPTPQQRHVAELLATGYSQNRAAVIAGVPQRTISAWWDERSYSEQFRKLVADIAAQFQATRVIDQSVRLAELIYHQVLTGELSNDDPTAIAARDLLAATSWKQYGEGGHKKFGT